MAAMLLLAVTTVVGAAPAAQAGGGGVLPDLACTVNFQIDFMPPLTATNPEADVLGQAGVVGCFSPNDAYPNLLSATVEGPGEATSVPGVPCNLLLTLEGSAEFNWNTGQVSEFDYMINTNPLNGLVTLGGEVTSGPLAGTTVTAVPVVAHPNLDCSLAGLETLTSEVTEVVFE